MDEAKSRGSDDIPFITAPLNSHSLKFTKDEITHCQHSLVKKKPVEQICYHSYRIFTHAVPTLRWTRFSQWMLKSRQLLTSFCFELIQNVRIRSEWMNIRDSRR